LNLEDGSDGSYDNEARIASVLSRAEMSILDRHHLVDFISCKYLSFILTGGFPSNNIFVYIGKSV